MVPIEVSRFSRTKASTSPIASPSTAPIIIVFAASPPIVRRSEEHTSELQSLAYLVCRLLLEKKKKKPNRAKTQVLHTTVHAIQLVIVRVEQHPLIRDLQIQPTRRYTPHPQLCHTPRP